MPRAVVERWGGALAIRLPADVAAAARLREGDRVDVVASGDAVVIRKRPADASLDALFAGRLPGEWRAFYRDAHEWGPDVGRERVDE